jgi:hypothetical protein
MTVAHDAHLAMELAGIRAKVIELSKQADAILATLDHVKDIGAKTDKVTDLLQHEHAGLRQAIVNILDELDRIAPAGTAHIDTT